jgi:hypothetical protein
LYEQAAVFSAGGNAPHGARPFELASGEIRSIKVGKRRLIPDTAIDEYIERLEKQCADGQDVTYG